ncbi:MAG: glycosyltransferase [Bacteroidota bacterium]
MKVLIISPTLKIGGIEKALISVADGLTALGVSVTFFVCNGHKPGFDLSDRPYPVVWSGLAYNGGFLNKVKYTFSLIIRMREEIRQDTERRVLCFGDFMNPLVLLAGLWLKAKIYVSDRTSIDIKYAPISDLIIQNGKRFLYPRSAGFIAQTERVRKHMNQRFGQRLRVEVIPNAIKLIRGEAPQEREKSILYVGRLSWEKGVDRLIQAFAKSDAPADWRLDIVGDGPLRRQYEAMVENLGIAKQVRFYGYQQPPDPYFLNSSIFVLPSHFEGFPNALCEAMSAGLPVACFASIPHEAIIKQDVHGVVVPADDIDAMAVALKRLMDDPELRSTMAANNVEHVKQFEASKIARKLLDFMQLKPADV